MRLSLTALILSATIATGDPMPGTFVQQLTQLAPENMTLPPELVTTFDWMEDQGWMTVRGGGAPQDHLLWIYPPKTGQEQNASMVIFGGSDLPFTGHWSTPDTAVDTRIFEVAGTSGDGGRAAIWLDEAGKQWFIHIGHDVIGVITDDPVTFLQFMAMGYGEPGALEATDITPIEQALYFNGLETAAELEETEGLPIMPVAFQAYLQDTFDRPLPATARDLGIADFTHYGDENSTDPFVQWLIKVTPPPTAEELAYVEELQKMAEDMDFDDLTLDDPIEPQGFFGKLKSLFGSNKN